MYSIQIQTIAAGASYQKPDGSVVASVAGHMYFLLNNNGSASSFGVHADASIRQDDVDRYQPTESQIHSASLELTYPQYKAIE